MANPKAIYLDYNATTPLAPEVLEAMLPFYQHHFGNPSSTSHQWGWAAQNSVDKARNQLAALLNTSLHHLSFTSGATEANNWLIQAIAEKHLLHLKQTCHFVSTDIEHPSVEEALKKVEAWGASVTRLEADKNGLISEEDFKKSLRPETRLASVIWVQNEIGTLQNIEHLASLARAQGVLFHSDATQGIGKIKLDLKDSSIDFLSASAHKFYGPKGCGFLYHKARAERIDIPALLVGGGQERQLRSGTLNVAGIVGLGKAAELADARIDEDIAAATSLQSFFLAELQTNNIPFQVNGSLDKRSPYNLNLSFPEIKMANFQAFLPMLAISQGSACHSDQVFTSPILRNLGVSKELAAKTLRFSWGRGSTAEDVRAAIRILKQSH